MHMHMHRHFDRRLLFMVTKHPLNQTLFLTNL